MEDFHHYNCPKNQYFRPNNWAKDHAVQGKGILGLPGAKEISFNQNHQLLPSKTVWLWAMPWLPINHY